MPSIFSPSDFRSRHSLVVDQNQLNFSSLQLLSGASAFLSFKILKGRGGVRGGEGSGPDREI